VRAVLLALLVSALAGAPAQAAPTLTVQPSRFGRVLFDGRGLVLYTFTKDVRRRSSCTGACATRWPPYVVSRAPRAGNGARTGLIDTIRRGDGRLQVTYDGRPLYFYVGDTPGVILCQSAREFGGLWLVVRADGSPVRSAP
jgi:predicted lipoprotein with Yx(FWY)xxD motif